jgi:hypothetical protein
LKNGERLTLYFNEFWEIDLSLYPYFKNLHYNFYQIWYLFELGFELKDITTPYSKNDFRELVKPKYVDKLGRLTGDVFDKKFKKCVSYFVTPLQFAEYSEFGYSIRKIAWFISENILPETIREYKKISGKYFDIWQLIYMKINLEKTKRYMAILDNLNDSDKYDIVNCVYDGISPGDIQYYLEIQVPTKHMTMYHSRGHYGINEDNFKDFEMYFVYLKKDMM